MKSGSHNNAKAAAKVRLDLLVVERGLATSRQRAQAIILAGIVRVDGQPATKAGASIARDAQIELLGEPLRYSSRGGLKLEGALDDFGVSPDGKICLDVGSSTGGFSDCLLQRGAGRVYALDVNIDQLDWKLRQDARIVPIEGNARFFSPDELLEAVQIVTMDVSFISVSKVLPAIAAAVVGNADFLILVKPQFELAKEGVGKGGIVRDERLHQLAIERVSFAAHSAGLEALGVRPSRITGAHGNLEYFLHARRHG
jgi:23S rRNA (cytidine1920-2'-O)/16S rRNA (cytidine1409-2'-O)-methyltransferase